MIFVQYASRADLMQSLADQMAAQLRSTLSANGQASLAVAGGTTPGPVFDALSAVDLDWAQVTVMPSDERWVDEQSDRSNARLIRQRLLTGRAAEAVFLPFYSDQSADRAMPELADRLTPLLPISVLMLGMGADMHTASLFPGMSELDAGLAEDAPPAICVTPLGQEMRVTLTAPVLKAAKNIHLLITGEEKRAALKRAEGLNASEAPVTTILEKATVHWAA